MAEKGVFGGKEIRKLKRRKAKGGYLTVVDYTSVLFSFCEYTHIFFFSSSFPFCFSLWARIQRARHEDVGPAHQHRRFLES